MLAAAVSIKKGCSILEIHFKSWATVRGQEWLPPIHAYQMFALALLNFCQHMSRVLQEVAILSRVENATESLLARCFENYYSLQENAPSGLLDGGVAAAEQPAPALQPAVELCNILRDVLKPGDQQWLTDRFKVAANRRYHRLLDGADATISRGGVHIACSGSYVHGHILSILPTPVTFMHGCIFVRLCGNRALQAA